MIPFGAMAEYYPISVRDQSRPHQFGKKVLPARICINREENLERRFSGRRNWKAWTRQKFILEESMQKKHWRLKEEKNSYSKSKMVQQNCQEETKNSENPLQGWNNM